MRIAIVTQDAPMYLPRFLDELVGGLRARSHEVVCVVLLPPYASGSLAEETRKRFALYGAAAFVEMSARILYHRLLAVFHEAMPGIGCHSVRNVLSKHDLERFATSDVNSPEFIRYVKDRTIDLVLSIACPQLFKPELLAAPAKGCLNYHTGLLPRYRGRQPLFWALLNGEREAGITVHEINEALDDGAILAQRSVPISDDDSLHSLYLKTTREGPALVIEAVEKIARGDGARIPNDRARATSHGFPGRDDGIAFRRRHRFF